MTRRRNHSRPEADRLARLAMAKSLAKRLAASPTDFRHLEVWYFDGQQWTMASRWEQKIRDQWQEVPWTALTDY
ncbi:MAG: hypothetical protein AB8B50_09280 [Pirellulaceae bacterium]